MMKWIVIGILWILAGGCIFNDIPDPVIYGNVTKIEFDGQQKCTINTNTRVVELTLSDTVDIQRVRLNILELEASPARKQDVLIEAKASIGVDTFLNLSKPYRFTVNTYQSYEWTIKAEQPIERWVKMENQVGEESINVQEKSVLVYVKKGQGFWDTFITDLQLGPSIATYEPDWGTLSDFKSPKTIQVNCFGRSEVWKIAVTEENEEEVDEGITVNEWAHFAYVSTGLSVGVGETLVFEYKSGGGSWQSVEAKKEGNVYQAKLEGLRANTKYTVRTVVGKEMKAEATFTTERAEQIPYSNFDAWYISEKADNEFATPGVKGEQIWDTGNEGGAGFNQIPTTIETEDVISGKAARLSSRWAVMKFAAGSLFTGKFVGITGMTNALLDFGIPYTCRPTQLKGYYKYIPGKVDQVGDKYNGKFDFLAGTTDSCHIYIALCDWEEKTFHANSTPPGTLVDYSRNNSSVLAYGELKSDREMATYKPFTIELEWRDTKRQPTCIVIVATSSKYGDYFTGSTESVLLIDEFELGFD